MYLLSGVLYTGWFWTFEILLTWKISQNNLKNKKKYIFYTQCIRLIPPSWMHGYWTFLHYRTTRNRSIPWPRVSNKSRNPGCLDSDIPIHNQVETMIQVRIITIKCNCFMFNAERRHKQKLACTLYVLTSKGLLDARYLM